MDKKYKNLAIELSEISNYFGQRYDLIQAAGGNSSIKLGNTMLIKSSGYSMAELSQNNGYSLVDNSKLINYLLDIGKNKITKTDENNSFKKLKLSLIEGGSPSIETFAHSLLNKYCIHLHPIGSNMLTVQKNSKLVINKLFKDEINNKEVYYIEYKTPGVSLAQAILKCIKGEYPIQNDCTFILENHGIISTSDDISKLIEMTERVANKIEKYLKLDFSRYKNTTLIYNDLCSIGHSGLSVLLCEDQTIYKLLKKFNNKIPNRPLNPDNLLYCGVSPLSINRNLKVGLKNYINKFKEYPRVIQLGDKVYFVAPNILKAKEVEDVFKSHLYLYSNNEKKRPLSEKDIKRLESYNPQKNRLRFWFDYEGKK